MTTRRLHRLCLNLTSDPTLRGFLTNAGVTEDNWRVINTAVREGVDGDTLATVLDAIDAAADKAGLEPVSTSTRKFESLPAISPAPIAGWRCPHPQPCARVQHPSDPPRPTCPFTGRSVLAISFTEWP
jgi:hypothetical protein